MPAPDLKAPDLKDRMALSPPPPAVSADASRLECSGRMARPGQKPGLARRRSEA